MLRIRIKTVENFFKLPEGRMWGSISTVEPDIDGRSIWIVDRCGANTCAGSNLPVVMKFDASGKLVRSFGAGMFLFPHGIHVDPQGNVWVVDGLPPGAGRGGAPPPAGRAPHREVQSRRKSAAAASACRA